jgi:hypothetical protein
MRLTGMGGRRSPGEAACEDKAPLREAPANFAAALPY